MSGADLGSGPEAESETADSREDGRTSFAAAVGAADEASDGLTSLGVAVYAPDEANDEVGFGENDHSFSGRLEFVFVSGSDQHCLTEVPVALEHGFV